MANIPGSINANSLSPIVVDGIPVDTLAAAIKHKRKAGQRTETLYWSSPRRGILDPTRDVFEVRLNQRHMVNMVAFEMANFPFVADLEYWDGTEQVWLPALTEGGAPTVLSNQNSVPGVIPAMVEQQGKHHPLHKGAGHWIKYSLKIIPVTSARYRLVCSRPFGSPPVDRFNTALPYPVAVRKFHVGYRIREKAHVPHRPPHKHHKTWHQPVDSTTDMLGSTFTYSLRENKANDLLRGMEWRSEPQPMTKAVVNFYADIRNAQGHAITIDRLLMDPLYSGVSVNLYYSNDTPSLQNKAEHLPQGKIAGTANIVANSVDGGLVFPNGLAFVDVDNRNVHFDPTGPWWIGIRYRPKYDSTDPTTYAIFDFLDVSLTVTQGVYSASLMGAPVTVASPFGTNYTQSLVVSYDGAATLSLTVLASDGTGASNSVTVDPSGLFPNGPADLLRFFGNQTSDGLGGTVDSLTGNAVLLDAMLKYGLPSTADLLAFGGDQDALDTYVNPPAFPTSDTGSTDNSPLRFTYQQIVAGVNDTGFLGGPITPYSTLTWTPVNRSFKAAKGYFDIPAIKAKYLNLEFTDLAPQVYETFQPIYRTVKLHPTKPTGLAVPYEMPAGGITVGSDIARNHVYQYGDFMNLDPPSLPKPSHGFTRTEAFYTSDPTTYPKLRNLSPLYGLVPWHPPGNPSGGFDQPGVHTYIETTIKQETRTVFFCGLSNLQVFRVKYEADDDTRQYEELFHDQLHVADNFGWITDDNDVHTPPSLNDPAQMTSVPFASRRKVVGVQFASSQSAPTQLLPDAEFNTFNFDGTPNLDQWLAVGDANLAISSDYNADVGSTVEITRTVRGMISFGQGFNATDPSVAPVPQDPLLHTWGAAEVLYETYQGISDTAQTYGSLSGLVDAGSTGGGGGSSEGGEIVGTALLGGIQTSYFARPATAGRLYAAVRVVAPQALQVPLWVQIISTERDVHGQPVVLAEEPCNVPGGAITEFYVGYTVGTGNVDTHSDVGVRVVQKWATGDTWAVDNISLFEDSIVWEFSNDGGMTFYPVFDIRNDPHGVFVFPDSTSDAGNALVWRVSGYRGDLHVNSVTIRPWYDTYNGPVPSREIVQTTGPQSVDSDHYPPIEMDPHWRMWSKPIPLEWWYFYRQWLLTTTAPTILPPFLPVFMQDNLVVTT